MMTTMRCMRAALAAALLVTTAAPALHAQPADPAPAAATNEEQAQALYESGVRHYNVAEYDEAIADYKAAYKLYPEPTFLYNIAVAYRMKGDCQQALVFYRTYLRNEPNPPNKDKIDQRVAEMEECVKKKGGTVTPPDGKDPLDKPPPDDRDPRDKSPPDDKNPDDKIVRPPPERARSDRRPGRTKKILGLTTMGVGLAAAATGVYFGLQAADAADEVQAFYDSMPGGALVWTQDLEDTEARGQRDETISLALYLAGGAAVVGGGVLWWLGHRDDRAARGDLHAAAVPLPGGGQLVLGWEF